MSVKKIILALVAAVLVGGFITLGVVDAVNRKDKFELQQVQLKSKTSEIKQLNVEHDKLNKQLEKAETDKKVNQEELDKINKEKELLEQQKREYEAQLQTKLDKKNSVQVASAVATNVQTAAATSGGSVKDIIYQAAIKHGLDPVWFYNLAECESTWTPSAVNYGYYEEISGNKYYPSGLYQHLTNYWPARAAQYGYAGASVFDAVANANVTAAMWKSGSHLWECR